SILENIIVSQIAHYNGSATIVRGIPDSISLVPSTNSILFYNHLPADLLNQEMEKAEFVIARCGYSTVMDLARLQKKSILIPTPGQTEQKYLSKYLMDKKIAFCNDQKKFSLPDSLAEAKEFSYRFSFVPNDRLRAVIGNFLRSIK